MGGCRRTEEAGAASGLHRPSYRLCRRTGVIPRSTHCRGGPRVGRCQDSRDLGNDPPTSWLLLPCLTARSGNVRRRISRDAEERDPAGVAICEGPWRWSHAHDGEPEGSEKQPSTCFLLLGNSNTSIMETRLLLLELPRRSIIPIFFGFLIPMGARLCRISLSGGSCRTESWPHSSLRGQIENRIS
jgi:hypothetical protein